MSVVAPSQVSAPSNVSEPSNVSAPSGVTELPAAGNGAPALPTANLALHLDYAQLAYNDAGSTLATDGQTVQEWHDLVAGRVFSEATNKPIWRDGVGIDYDGTNDVLADGLQTGAYEEPSGLYWSITRPHALPASEEVIINLAKGTDNINAVLCKLDGPNIGIRVTAGGSTLADIRGTTTTLLVNTWYDLVWLSTGSAYRLFVNGVEQALTIDAGTNSGDWNDALNALDNRIGIGAFAGSSYGAAGMDGDHAKLGRHSAYTAADLPALFEYLASVRPS
jgi:hypothetical protein